jgi:hypothetical protein
MGHGTHCNQGEYLGGCKYGEASKCTELNKKDDMNIPENTPISVFFWPNLPNKKTLDEFTFGATPAARYLVRELNSRGQESLNRSIGKRITTTAAMVQDLLKSYYEGTLSAKTVANTLRLMREEIVRENNDTISDDTLLDHLRSNVQIGYIKQGIRLCTVARKAERVMQSPLKRASNTRKVGNSVQFKFKDSNTNSEYVAGAMFNVNGEYHFAPKIFSTDEIADVTPEILEARSQKRCKRLNKPHTRV